MFESILGHENVKKTLLDDFESGTVSHAYLFSGIDGIGKKLTAIEFAKKLLNTNNLSTCVDYEFIQKAEDKKEIVVEQVRNRIVNDVYVAPATGRYKVYIVDDAHFLNISAQNALLKTLEEPPKHVVIILITNNEKALLTTVLSRVKKVNFSVLSNDDIASFLKINLNKEITNEKLDYANGSLNLAIELVENVDNNKYNQLDEMYKCIKNKDKLKLTKSIEQINFKDEETFNYIQHLFYIDRLYDKITCVEQARKRMKQNANEDIVKQAFSIKVMKEM